MKYPFSTDTLAELTPEFSIATLNASKPSTVRRTRYKLWELQSCWHCMVVGTCLTVDDVRQCATKAKISIIDKSDYDLHQLSVECAANKQRPLTQQLQNRLEHRYASAIKSFRHAKDPTNLAQLWKSGWENGQVAGSLWALITNPMVTRELIVDVFGEVHMMSHLSGANHCSDKRRLNAQERQIITLSDALEKTRTQANKARQTIDEQKHCLESEQALSRHLSAQLKQIQITPPNTPPKHNYPEGLVDELRRKIAVLRQDLNHQDSLSRKQSVEVDRLQRMLEAQQQTEPSQVSEETLKLCGQCVLYLGGKANQRRHFQALVESCDGRFLHHDGGRETCPHRITELVSQADVVMCPTDCISHSAMEKARSLCAKQEKPIIFMERASLSTFTKSLHQALG